MRRAVRALPLCLALCLRASGCTPVPTVTPNPVPPAEPLQVGDCDAAVTRYEALLARPTPGPLARPLATVEEPPMSAETFRAQCLNRLAGKARRTILRCWRDADGPATFLACNERF